MEARTVQGSFSLVLKVINDGMRPHPSREQNAESSATSEVVVEMMKKMEHAPYEQSL